MKKVKCRYCNQEFDREYADFVKVSNRYAHRDCYEHSMKQAEELKRITDLVKELYYPTVPNWKLITAQIKRYVDEGKTYEGIYYTLVYFFVIQKNDIHKGVGLGIIPYVYNKAKAYYSNQHNIYTKTAEIQSKENLDIEQTENIITISNSIPKKKLLDFDY